MKLEASFQALDAINAIVRKQIDAKWAELADVADETAKSGAKTAQSYTASRPGEKTGKSGRVDSSAMIEAIRSENVSVTDSEIHSRYGFVEEFKDYFKYQTVTGFTHNRSGQYIAPTFALRDSINPTRDYAVRAGRSIR